MRAPDSTYARRRVCCSPHTRPVQTTAGVYGFVAQLNEGRATKKRATEFRVDRVCQPFDPSKFNFRKAAMKEVRGPPHAPRAVVNTSRALSPVMRPPSQA